MRAHREGRRSGRVGDAYRHHQRSDSKREVVAPPVLALAIPDERVRAAAVQNAGMNFG